MEFKPVDDERYYYCRYYKKYYQIIEATYLTPFLIVDIKAKECELKYIRTEIVPRDPKNSKEFFEEDTYEMIPTGRKKKFIYESLRLYELQDRFVYKERKD